VLLLVNGPKINSDIELLALSMLVSLVVVFLLKKKYKDISELALKLILYVSALLAVWVDKPGSISGDLRIALQGFVFIGFVICLGIKIFFDKRAFELSAMDLMVVLSALILPNLPGTVISNYFAGWMVAKAIIIFYVIEYFFLESSFYKLVISSVFFVFLSAILLL
jgi:hypothetical protein